MNRLVVIAGCVEGPPCCKEKELLTVLSASLGVPILFDFPDLTEEQISDLTVRESMIIDFSKIKDELILTRKIMKIPFCGVRLYLVVRERFINIPFTLRNLIVEGNLNEETHTA